MIPLRTPEPPRNVRARIAVIATRPIVDLPTPDQSMAAWERDAQRQRMGRDQARAIWQSRAGALGPRQLEVLAFLKARGEALNAQAVADALGIKRQMAQDAINKLRIRGLIRNVGTARRPLWRPAQGGQPA
jgi:hypothetical protein